MFTDFGLDQNPCQNYQTLMKEFVESLNAIFRVLCPLLKMISEALRISLNSNSFEFKMIHDDAH